MSLLHFKEVRLEYKWGKEKITVLENISLHIHKGEFITIIGPSGCGKSSLLKLASGIELPTSGTVSFDNKKIVGTDPRIGMMLQQPTLFPWLTVEDNIGFGLKMKGINKEERSQKIQRYLEHMDLSSFAKYRTYELSGGMKQRVALARTLINNPDIVIMDEPFAALDAITKNKMHELVQDIWRETGKAFIFVTHDIEEAVKLGSRVIVMSSRPGHIMSDLSLGIKEKQGGSSEKDAEYKQVVRSVYKLLSQIE